MTPGERVETSQSLTWDEVIKSGCFYCWWKRADAEHPKEGAKWEISRPDKKNCPIHGDQK